MAFYLEAVAVGRLVCGAVLHLGRLDRDLGGEAGAKLVRHDQDLKSRIILSI